MIPRQIPRTPEALGWFRYVERKTVNQKFYIQQNISKSEVKFKPPPNKNWENNH